MYHTGNEGGLDVPMYLLPKGLQGTRYVAASTGGEAAWSIPLLPLSCDFAVCVGRGGASLQIS